MEQGKVVYVGGIPYDQTEEQILDIFKSVGPVAGCRLIFDKDTGKSKGFGFVEYHDTETAASAVRNLNNYHIGQRTIRVDFPHESMSESSAPIAASLPAKIKTNHDSHFPNLPKGVNPPPGTSVADAINNALNVIPKTKTLQIITDLQSMAKNDVQLTAELLKLNPQLAYAAVQAMLSLGLTNTENILAMVINGPTTVSQPQLPQIPQAQLPQIPQPSSNRNSPAPGAFSSKPDAKQAKIIRGLLALTGEQLNSLPPDQKVAIDILRERVERGEIIL